MKRGAWIFGLGVVSAVAYALIARLLGAGGFPLDDGWIHQVYARNLGWHGQWAFVLGEPSAGSTSPLWTALLSIGYLLPVDYSLWTLALNAMLLGTLAWLAYRLTNLPWAGLLVALEWHLVWAAASGMETILFCVLVMAAYLLVSNHKDARFHLVCGLLIGLAVWTRPDGLTLLPFCTWLAWVGQGGLAFDSQRLKRLAFLLGGVALVILPYFVFNIAISGQVWPNTFFAKQAEYAPLQVIPIWQRMANLFTAPFVGVLLLLLPGLFLRVKARWVLLLWAGSFLLLYVLRLPVTYQHGRYLIPVIPVLMIVGIEGLAGWVQLNAAAVGRRVVSRAWALGTGAVAVAFWGVGANALVTDIKVINNEMVATARWVSETMPPGTLVAAHDIGALGYFANVRLVDLAGLVSPAVIPLMGDEAQLWGFVRESGARYVITYPGWCPSFVTDPSLEPVFQTGPLCSPQSPNLHMAVYLIH